MAESQQDDPLFPSKSERRISLLEYGLIAGGLALVIVFGTQSISHTVREAYMRNQVDQMATASIKKRAEHREKMGLDAPYQPMPEFPKP